MSSRNNFSGKNQRKYERLDKKFGMRYCVLAEGELPKGNPAEAGELLDIGGGGLRFASKEKIEKNKQLEILIEFSGWQVEEDEWNASENNNVSGFLKVIGIVMWTAPCEDIPEMFEIGVRFSGRIG